MSHSFTPEQIAAAKELIAKAEAAQNNTTSTGTTESTNPSAPAQEDETAQPSPAVIPAELVDELTEIFLAAMANPDFFTKDSRVAALKNALKVPMFDGRSMQQFAIAAKDELIKTAMDLAIKNSTVPVMPTEDEIKALAQAKHDAKLAKETEKAAEKAAKKKP